MPKKKSAKKSRGKIIESLSLPGIKSPKKQMPKAAVKKSHEKSTLKKVDLPELITDKEIEAKIAQRRLDDKLMMLVDPEFRIDQTLKDLTAELSGAYVLLLTVQPSKYTPLQRAILRHFLNNLKIPGIYITTNKPYETLQNDFLKQELDISKIQFIDMITEMASGEEGKSKSCKYFGTVTELTELIEYLDSLSVNNALEGKFLVLDSVSTMLVYNSPAEVERLIHTLIIKSREWRMKTILLAIENQKQNTIVETISQFCDSVAKI